MLIIGIIAVAVFIIMFILIIEKRGDPDYLERFYKPQGPQSREETKNR